MVVYMLLRVSRRIERAAEPYAIEKIVVLMGEYLYIRFQQKVPREIVPDFRFQMSEENARCWLLSSCCNLQRAMSLIDRYPLSDSGCF